MPIFSPPGSPDMSQTPITGMSPQLQQQIQMAMMQNPELYPKSSTGQNIDPSELNSYNSAAAQRLAAARAAQSQQGLGGVAAPPSGGYSVDRVQR